MSLDAAKDFLGHLRDNPRQAVALQGLPTCRVVQEGAARGFDFTEEDLRLAFRKAVEELAKNGGAG